MQYKFKFYFFGNGTNIDLLPLTWLVSRTIFVEESSPQVFVVGFALIKQDNMESVMEQVVVFSVHVT
jgi:hypothetical protein